MATINDVKQMAAAETPLLFFACVLPDGTSECWCSHSISLNGIVYHARVLKHNLFDLQLSADDAMDGISKLSLTLANADGMMSQVNNQVGFKGTQVVVYFAFADLTAGQITTETTVLFKGVAGDPDEITSETLRLTFNNKLSLQRVAVPDVRIQRQCPWSFPTTAAQRAEAVNGGTAGRYSKYYRCGYSADQPGGVGNLGPGGTPFTTCDYTRASCQQRGMFSTDARGNLTRRFGGFDFIPTATLVRTSGSKTTHTSAIVDTTARYNNPVPIVYGSGWLDATVIFSRNDGNLTHAEVLLSIGPVNQVLKVVVNDVEVPLAVPGKDLTTTGWYSVFAGVADGSAAQFRQGNLNADFQDLKGNPLGDPYGSMAAMSVVVPNRIASGGSAPRVQVLLQGVWLDRFNSDGTDAGNAFSQNPSWVILDILRRAGWQLSELNLKTFANAANFCDEFIAATNVSGVPVQIPRYKCNLVLTSRKSAAEVIRGIRVAASLMLRYGVNGLLELLPERDIVNQQPTLPDGSNSVAPSTSQGGWPAYEFSDGTGVFSGIVEGSNGQPTLVLTSRSVAESSNRLSVEFQDEENEYQQDSLSVTKAEDVDLIGYEVSSQSTAVGIANYSQATRVLLRQLDKSTDGNQYVQFQTSFRALKLRPGDIVALTYNRESMIRQLFRVTRLSPSLNYTMVTIQAQVHDDAWYSDSVAVLSAAGRQPGSSVGVPRPLLGTAGTPPGTDFGASETIQKQSDGSSTDIIAVSFVVPVRPSPHFQASPRIGRTPALVSNSGTLAPGNYYYGFTSVDGTGAESVLSSTILVQIPPGTNTNSVSFDSSQWTFPSVATGTNVYRGTTPQTLRLVAKNHALTNSFTDSGSSPAAIGPPDANFDHANFYYRTQYTSPIPADIFSANTIGSFSLGAVDINYFQKIVRIISGSGFGQERSIGSNDSTTLTLTTAWSTQPDATSTFVIVDSAWKLGAISSTSPVQLQLPYVKGNGIQISGRGANVANLEGAADLCPMTSFVMGMGDIAAADTDIPPAPNVTILAPGGGNVTVSEISFSSLRNTATITSGTLNLFFWNELNPASTMTLIGQLDPVSTGVSLNRGDLVQVGDVLAIESELLTVVSNTNNSFTVVRASMSSTAAAHNSATPVLLLNRKTVVLPFAKGYFEQRSSQNYLHSVYLPDLRIYAAQLQLSNGFGAGQTTSNLYLSSTSQGLRTLSGGQLSLQVNGYLAVEANALPPLTIEATHAVRDVRATVGTAATGSNIAVTVWQNGVSYCSSLVIPAGQTASNPVDGLTLPILNEGSQLTLSVTQVGSSSPGRDLTVTIRL